jgi:hypothetical protein
VLVLRIGELGEQVAIACGLRAVTMAGCCCGNAVLSSAGISDLGAAEG